MNNLTYTTKQWMGDNRTPGLFACEYIVGGRVSRANVARVDVAGQDSFYEVYMFIDRNS